MPRYRVMFETSATTTVDVDATDEAAAVTAAEEEVYVGLCHQCAHSGELGDFEVRTHEGKPEVIALGDDD